MKNFLLGVVTACAFLLLETATGHTADYGTGLICDTQKQVEQFVQAFDESKNAQASLYAVNSLYAGTNNVCAVGTVSFDVMKIVSRLKGGSVEVAQVTVYGVVVGMIGEHEPVVSKFPQPVVQYTMFKAKGIPI